MKSDRLVAGTAPYDLIKKQLQEFVAQLIDLNRRNMGGKIGYDAKGNERWEHFRSSLDVEQILTSTISFSKAVDSFVDRLDAWVAQDSGSSEFASTLISDMKVIIHSTVAFSRHLEITETAVTQTRKEGTRRANQGRVHKRGARLAIARPLILHAARKSNGSLLSPDKLLRAVNEKLKTSSDQGKPHREIGPKTLARYVEIVESEGQNVNVSK